MTIEIISKLIDKRTDCLSVMTEISIKNYLDNFKFENRIEGQREVLKTTSGIAIRERLIKDIAHGTVIPPIVLGILSEEKVALDSINEQFFKDYQKDYFDSISIIDGMQRTAALIQGLSLNPKIGEQKIRIEFWISDNISSLVYRMLVLNTGQVPWTVRRQIEVINKPLIQDVKKHVRNITIHEIDDSSRRKDAGEYPADSIVELYSVYGARKEDINPKERLADEFNRLDFIKMTSQQSFSENFYKALQLLVNFDKSLSRYKGIEGVKAKYNQGKDLFTSKTSRVGFMVALAQEIQGRPGGSERSSEVQVEKLNLLNQNLSKLITSINLLSEEELGEFLSYNTLNEKIQSLPTKRIGDAERDFFVKAFSTLVDAKFDVSSLNEAWMAY